jgi:hypothetical protein
MANGKFILNKIARNLEQYGLVVARGSADQVLVAGLVVSYVDASIQSPMGGVSDASSPFLGIGIANPGKLKIKGAAGENAIADIFVDAADLNVLAVVARFANDVVVEAGDSAAELAVLRGHPDMLNVGE